MPTKSRREDTIIKRFLSGYGNLSWADADVEWPDKRRDAAVKAVATRKSDGKKLAIEHTIIEPFFKEKEDFAQFSAALLKIEEDKSLAVPGRWIQVFVPVGTLRNQHKPTARNAIVATIHEWLRTNRLSLPLGDSEHRCAITGTAASCSFEITLNIRAYASSGRYGIHIRRRQVENNLGYVIEKALRKKLPKLMQTTADARILLFERQHMNLYPKLMVDELESRKAQFPDLDCVEIWIVETMSYEKDSYLRFERYENGTLTRSLDFEGSKLLYAVSGQN